MRHATIELDVSELPSAECIGRVLTEFDRLLPDETVVVRSGGKLTMVLHALQRERPNLFEWYPREAGPGEYRVEICRRRDGSHRSVGEMMECDHQRLERVLAEIEWEANERMFERARRRLRDLRTGLLRHIAMEERIVYPEYQRVSRADARLLRTLEIEHSILERMLDDVEEAITAHDSERAEGALCDLRDLLIPHARIERARIYPAVDMLAGDGAALVVAMQEV